MKVDYFKIAIKEIQRRRLRSWLTLIGIIIGIAAVVSLITLGQGLQNAIEGQFAALGNDKLFIAPQGNALTLGLTTEAIIINDDDLRVVERVQGVRRVTGFVSTTAKIEFNDRVRYFIVFGQSTDPEERALLGESQNYKIGRGRLMEKGDKSKVILGYDYQEKELFGKAIDLGDKVEIAGREFSVIGFLEKIGSPPDDRSVGMAMETYEELFETNGQLAMIVAQTQPGEDIARVAERVEKDLRSSRDVGEGKEDFGVQTPEQLGAIFAVILDIVQIVLLGIAAISLFVGGINIMNTMYTAVLERTKQIGVMKALGAQNSHVLTLFLVESGLYGLGGGVIGVTIGVGIAKLVELGFILAVGPAFLSVEIDWLLIFGSLLFSFVAGTLSGIAPAYRASKLNPVDSLRYE